MLIVRDAVIGTMQVEVDGETGEPFDTLTAVAVDWCRSVGCNLTRVSDIIDYSNETVREL